MKAAVLTFSPQGLVLAARLKESWPDLQVYLHQDLQDSTQKLELEAVFFARIMDLWQHAFQQFDGWICIAPTGAIVRACAPVLEHKTKDPAVVVVDAGGRHAVSLLSGHEGGANNLAFTVSNILWCEPVISTTTEAVKTIIAGVGCRKDTPAEHIIEALDLALDMAHLKREDIRVLGTAEIKAKEHGLQRAAQLLEIPLRIIPHEDIHWIAPLVGIRDSVMNKIGLPGVAEPTALLAGRRTRICLNRIAHKGVTIALAQEDCWWLGLDQEASKTEP